MNHRLHLSLIVALTWAASLSAQDIRPFRIEVKDFVLQDLRKRLEMTRWPETAPTSDWQYGVPLEYAKALAEHWRTNFDWHAHEKEINAFPQFKTEIDGIDLHFMHVLSPHEKALPLVLVHGWPGSFVEFMKVIGPLTEPEKHGGKMEDAFHVVIPSLPGFGFSGKPKEQGWSSQRMAEVIAKLMARLGYLKYGAQGGDWGGGIVRTLAGSDGGHCIGAHSNFPGANRPTDGTDGGATSERTNPTHAYPNQWANPIKSTRSESVLVWKTPLRRVVVATGPDQSVESIVLATRSGSACGSKQTSCRVLCSLQLAAAREC